MVQLTCTMIQLANVFQRVGGPLAAAEALVVLATIHPQGAANRYCGGTFYPPTHHGTKTLSILGEARSQLVSSPDPTLSRGRRARGGHETSADYVNTAVAC